MNTSHELIINHISRQQIGFHTEWGTHIQSNFQFNKLIYSWVYHLETTYELGQIEQLIENPKTNIQKKYRKNVLLPR